MEKAEKPTYREINQRVIATLGAPGRLYLALVAFAAVGFLTLYAFWAYQIKWGLGVSGDKHPTVWGVYLVSFVFWVGIAHSGTLISAILFLFRASWRTTIARSAEAMTVFAVVTAGLFPLIHLGRVWVVYWILPYPNQRNLWPNFQSPLVFDVIAISTYLTVSVLFWYTGLIPDLATVRDNTKGLRSKIYGFFSLGWTNSSNQWRHHSTAYLLFAALATPLVVSVHSVVSWDFALAIVPGWHSTIFAPYFVAGAIHSGLAMVITLLIPLRYIYKFEDLITMEILEDLAKTIILTGAIVGYSYSVEFFLAWYSGNRVEWDQFVWRTDGHYAWQFWVMVLCNAVIPLAFFVKKIRTSIVTLFGISVLINFGMWCERYVIIVGSVAHEFDPYSWGYYWPRLIDGGIAVCAFLQFFLLFLLFVKLLPSISMTEAKEALPPPMRKDTGE